MAAFVPISDSHAIYEVAVGLILGDNLSPSVLKNILELHDELKDELPKKSTRELVQKIVLSPDESIGAKSEQKNELHGFSFSRVKPDGGNSWVLRIDRNEVFVNCLDYTGWNTVWPKAYSYLEKVAPLIGDMPVMGIRCQFLDQFAYDGEQGESSPRELIREDSKYITEQALQSAPYWHVHQGWFDETPLKEIDNHTLHQINIDSLPSDGKDITNISHVMTLQFKTADTLYSSLFITNEDDPCAIDTAMDYLHSYNKRFLNNLLQPEICERIALNAE